MPPLIFALGRLMDLMRSLLSLTTIVQPDGSNAISSISKAELFAQTFANNTALDDSRLVPPSPPPSDYFMLPSSGKLHSPDAPALN